MIDDIKLRLEESVFRPFTIVTSSGARYHVASRDHVSFGPKQSRLIVWFDDDTSVLIAGLHMVAMEEDETAFRPTRPGTIAS